MSHFTMHFNNSKIGSNWKLKNGLCTKSMIIDKICLHEQTYLATLKYSHQLSWSFAPVLWSRTLGLDWQGLYLGFFPWRLDWWCDEIIRKETQRTFPFPILFSPLIVSFTCSCPDTPVEQLLENNWWSYYFSHRTHTENMIYYKITFLMLFLH